MQRLGHIGDAPAQPIFAAVGFFDGVHRGHQALIHAARQAAEEARGLSAVLTFDSHPLAQVAPERVPPLLEEMPARLEKFRRLGVELVFTLPFTAELAQQPAEEFAQRLPPRFHCFCGENWRFGAHAAGTPETLKRLGIPVEIVPYAMFKGEAISSSRIRAAILRGDMESAAAMLGRPYALTGTVVHGRGVGKSELCVATANIEPPAGLALPPHGVYATTATVAGQSWPALTDFGTHPTFGASPTPLFETHLIGFTGELYQKTLQIDFLARLRGEQTFASPQDLKAQIARDLAARQRLEK